MRSVAFLTIAIVGIFLINSCQNESEDYPLPAKDVIPEKRDVSTYEIVNLIAREELASKYHGSFGTATVELVKTSDSTLTFYVPDVPEGEAQLKFDLATINFNVTQTPYAEANEVISGLTSRFNARVDLLNPSTPEEVDEVKALIQYKGEVISLFNSLTADQKRQAILFYEANKHVFAAFANDTFTHLDGATSMRLQSECPRTDFKSFYGCTAENLGEAALQLKDASREFLEILALAGLSAYLAPASFGLSAAATTLALGTAGYLLITEVRPAALHFRYSLSPFLKANWIFSKALFQATTEVFQEQLSTSLNLLPKFRSLTSNDTDVSPESTRFIKAISALKDYWNRLAAVFGALPVYQNTEEPATLATGEITVSEISNPNVEYLGNNGQSVAFRSLSGNEEEFNFKVTVHKEGFVEEKSLKGRVLASDPCDDNGTTAPVITDVTITCDASNQLAILISFTANGPGALIGSDYGSCEAEGLCYPTRLYFNTPGSPEYSIAANGYDVSLKSGTTHAGIIEMKLKSLGSCMSGKSAAETLEYNYPGYGWKVELMNQCNQRSQQWPF